jgi:formylglycine-generating enzyme required for sulfatase activity
MSLSDLTIHDLKARLPPVCAVTLAAVLAVLVSAFTLETSIPAAPAPPPFVPTIEPASHRSYTQTIPDSKVRFDMVAIPGGVFRMGSPESEKGRGRDEGPQRPVRIRPFWMGRTEVTWDEYDLYFKRGQSERDNQVALAKDVDAITRPTPPYPDETRGYGREGYPVLGISHHAAMEYCRWLSRTTGKAYRLPTEAEWEWAARAGTTTPYHFGDDPKKLGDYGWFARNSNETTHPVGKKKPNPWGLYDICGNVAEWCLDHYRRDSYATFSHRRATLGPVLLPTANRFSHVARGGSFEDEAPLCRSAARRASEPSWNKIDPDKPKSLWWLWNADFVGFRVVRAVEEQKDLRGIRSKVTKKSP